MKKILPKKWVRILIAILLPLIILSLLLYVYIEHSPFKCVLYELTGLLCFGCGSGRALYELLHFNILKAMQDNIFFVIALPFLFYYFLSVYVNYLFQRKVIKRFKIKQSFTFVLIGALFLYIILRNLPFEFFWFLRP